MYGRGHLRNSDSWRQVGRKPSQPMYMESAEVRIARWEAKVAAQKAAQEAEKAATAKA